MRETLKTRDHQSMIAGAKELKTFFHFFFKISQSLTFLGSVLELGSSSSFELFVTLRVTTFMQEDVHIGHIALALALGLQVFS